MASPKKPTRPSAPSSARKPAAPAAKSKKPVAKPAKPAPKAKPVAKAVAAKAKPAPAKKPAPAPVKAKASVKPQATKPQAVKAKPVAVSVAAPRKPVARPAVASAYPAIPPRVQVLIDRQEIVDLLALYSRAIDRMDEPLLRSLYHPDATQDAGPGIFQGTAMDFVTWKIALLSHVKNTFHMLGLPKIDMQGDSAVVETYFFQQLRLEKPTGREDLMIGGRYIDRFDRRNDVWKIAHRKELFDWVRTMPAADMFYHQNPDALWGVRGAADWASHLDKLPGGPDHKPTAFTGRRYEGKTVKF
jgi:hypothetical protein